MKKTGIFGGSFDPVHSGHVKLAGFMTEKLRLDEMLIVPAAMSPFKNTVGTSDKNRLAMCRLSFADEKYSVLTNEIDRRGKSYTYDTVCEIQKQYPERELYLIIGSDQLLQFTRWFRYRDILQKCVLCAVSRSKIDKSEDLEDYAEKNLRMYGKCVIIEFDPLEISSTEVRAKAARGESLDGLVPAAVNAYIKEKGLYLKSEI